VYGVVVASNRQVRIVFHRELGFKYQNLLKRINLGQTKGEGKKNKTTKTNKQKEPCIYDFAK